MPCNTDSKSRQVRPPLTSMAMPLLLSLAWTLCAVILGGRFRSFELVPAVLLLGWLVGRRYVLFCVLSAGLVLLAMGLFVITPCSRSLVEFFQPTDPLQKVDAVVVLSSGVKEGRHLSSVSLNRLFHGVHLVRKGWSHNLVVTDLPSEFGDPSEDRASVLHSLPSACTVHAVGPVRTTQDEANHVFELARANKWTSVIVVTSDLHSRRARASFSQTGLKVISSVAPNRTFDGLNPSAADALYILQRSVYEVGALLKNWLFGELTLTAYLAATSSPQGQPGV